MAGVCVAKLPHSCGSRSALQVFDEEGDITGYCFSCNTFVPDPLGGKSLDSLPPQKLKKTPEEVKEELNFISSLPSLTLKDRRLKKEHLEHYGIKVGVSEKDGKTIAFHHYPYKDGKKLKAYKTRYVPSKAMWSVGDQKEVDLFGWEQAVNSGARRLIIVEGELDAPAARQILHHYTKPEYVDHIPAVCSLPHGAASAKKDLARLAPKIRKFFKEVSFCFDQDEAGERAVKEASLVFPEATTISLPAKDVNDCIMEGCAKKAFSLLTFRNNAEKPKNSTLVWGEDVHESAREQAPWGLSWPWKGLTNSTRGVRFGETYYLGAGEKMGLQ